MNRACLNWRVATSVLGIVLMLFSCKSSEPNTEVTEELGISESDEGQWVNDRRYENQVVGIYFEAPEKWYLKKGKDPAAVKRALKMVERAKEGVKHGVAASYNPFWVYKVKPSEDFKPMNASLDVKKVPPLMKGKTSTEIAMVQRDELAVVEGLSFPEPVSEVSINGQNWSRQMLQVKRPNKVWFQHVFITVKNDFLLIYGVSYPEGASAEDIKILENAIGAL